MAYLVPAAYAAGELGRKAIVSTYTIHLQEQLFGKDVPIVQSLVPFEFTAALLKGRQNYLCPHRLRKAQAQQGELFATGQAEQLRGLVEWSERTRDGTLSDLDFAVDAAVWAQVCSEAFACTPRHCGGANGCFYQKARAAILDANVVIVNHALLFGLLAGLEQEEESPDEGESFTKTIARLLQGHLAVQGTCGAAVEQAVQIWGGKGSAAEADRMERVVEEGRKSTSWEQEPLR